MTYSLQPGAFEAVWKKILYQEFLERIQRTAKHDYEDSEYHEFDIFIFDSSLFSL